MSLRPIMVSWDGETLVPHARFLTLCRRQFVEGEDYALGPVDNIPGKSRAQFFASIRDTWDSLPDHVGQIVDKKTGEIRARWPTTEHLRKWLLVQVGWSVETFYTFETAKDLRLTAIALRRADEYAVIEIKDSTLRYASAKSIAGGAIKVDDWKWVKRDALDLAASLTGATRGELERHSRSGGGR